jgi:hypothetical protein
VLFQLFQIHFLNLSITRISVMETGLEELGQEMVVSFKISQRFPGTMEQNYER